MAQLSIYMLGSPHLTLDGEPVKIPTSRAIPLLAYLALTGIGQTREMLAALLWPDSNQKQALAALRTTLWRLKSAGLENWITLDRDEITLDLHKGIEIDVIKFQNALDRCSTHGHPPSQICLYCTSALTEAVALYHGDFLAGFHISKAPSFDDWRMQQSETLEMLHLDALERLVRCHRTYGDFNLAIHYARLWLGFDRLNENAHFQLLQLYSITGQRTAGISLYKQYKDRLAHELGIEPNEELSSLYKQIVTGGTNRVVKPKTPAPVFLIADIEKSALYWARAGDKKNEIISTYTNIVKETARRFGGLILQKSEDNLTLLFENGQPLHCAVTIHLRLKKMDWGEAGPPGIRMVLYSTFTEADSSANFAMITRTASTLLSISWAGQVIFSDQTLKLLDIPSGSNINDLGVHFLNDKDGSVHVYELEHPHLPALDHPPLRAGTHQMVNFPVLVPPFIGREQEMDELSELLSLSDDRIITLVGPGGIGKTRLAVQAASQVSKFYPDGTYFISLASIQDPNFIPILLADALKFNFYGTKDHLEQLCDYLHRMKVLLVLDNFEHLRVDGAKFLAFLLSDTHYLKALVTSRERLNMIGENVIEVHGMPVPATVDQENAESYSSIKLFLQNAKKNLPRFSFQNNHDAIIQVCQAVDGIPLAILLASSWVRVFSCSEIASEVRKNIDFLTISAPDIDPRHRSLNAVFENSWRLLSDEERSILPRLSIFKSAFTAQAASEICNAPVPLLTTFADKSLLHHRPDGRFEMLATFQQYAFSKLAQDEQELSGTRSRFCEYYANFCAQERDELYSPDQQRSLHAMISEIENIRVAWSWMVDYDRWDLVKKIKDPFYTYHNLFGYYLHGVESFRYALLKLDKAEFPGHDLLRAQLRQVAAWLAFRNGFLHEGIRELSEVYDVFLAQNSFWDISRTLFYLAEANRTMGHLQQAKSFLEQALAMVQADGIEKTNYVAGIISYCQSHLGMVLMSLGDNEQASINFTTSLATNNRLGSLFGTIFPLMGLGRLAFLDGNFLKARDLYLQALDIALNINDHRSTTLIHNNLGAVYEQMACPAESHHHVVIALKLCQETGDRRLTAVILNNLAYQQLRFLHQPAEAIRTYHESMQIFLQINDLRGVTYSYYDVSKAYLQVGLLEEAWGYCQKSLNTAMTLDSNPLILHALHGFANFFANTGAQERALGVCYLILSHQTLEMDTHDRVIVTIAELETSIEPEIIQAAHLWSDTALLQDVINQLATEKSQSFRPSP